MAIRFHCTEPTRLSISIERGSNAGTYELKLATAHGSLVVLRGSHRKALSEARQWAKALSDCIARESAESGEA